MDHRYDPALVILAIAAAVLACSIALGLTVRIGEASKGARLTRLAVAGLAMGGGLAGMHYVSATAARYAAVAQAAEGGRGGAPALKTVNAVGIGTFAVLLLLFLAAAFLVHRHLCMRRWQEAELRAAKEAVERMNERLRYALEGANDGLWDWDIPSGTMYLSPRLEAILGYAPGERSSSYDVWEADLHPDDRDQTLALLGEMLAGRTPDYAAEYRIRTKSGRWVWVLDRGKVVERDQTGQPIRAVGTLTDISARKETEQALRERDEQLRLALRSAQAGVWFLDVPTNRLVWSEETCRIYGIDPDREQPSNEVWLSRLHPEDRPWIERLSEDILRRGQQEYRVEFRIVHPQTGIRWLLARGQVTYDKDGRPLRMSGIAIDITDRKETEMALLEAKRQAETASRTKSEFLANMSHELRTPLNAIIGFSELMKDEMFGPLGVASYREYAADIHDSGTHLLELINDILDLSKVEAGRLVLSPGPVVLERTIEVCLALLKGRVEGSGLALETKIPPDLPPLWGDERRIKQILLNLLSNAIKFTPSGGRVQVSARRDGDDVVVEISDSGIGMDPKEIAVALEPFRQLDSTLSRRYEGTGLGLPLAKSLVELHGGVLTIASAPGQGTTVSITLPVDTGERGRIGATRLRRRSAGGGSAA